VSDYTPNEAEALLIAALRSGEYKQGMNCLREGGAFCCLGVASDLYAKAHPGAEWKPDGTFSDGERVATIYLTTAVRLWLGWYSPQGSFKSGLSLANENDRGASFEAIADIIERGEVLRAEPSK
jgi:hypothetical protein